MVVRGERTMVQFGMRRRVSQELGSLAARTSISCWAFDFDRRERRCQKACRQERLLYRHKVSCRFLMGCGQTSLGDNCVCLAAFAVRRIRLSRFLGGARLAQIAFDRTVMNCDHGCEPKPNNQGDEQAETKDDVVDHWIRTSAKGVDCPGWGSMGPKGPRRRPLLSCPRTTARLRTRTRLNANNLWRFMD